MAHGAYLDWTLLSLRLSGLWHCAAPHLPPSFRGDILDLPVCHRRQPLEYIAKASVRIDPSAPTTLHHRAHDCAPFPSLGLAKEQPVFLPNYRGSDRPFAGIVINLHPSVCGRHQHGFPLPQGEPVGLALTAVVSVDESDMGRKLRRYGVQPDLPLPASPCIRTGGMSVKCPTLRRQKIRINQRDVPFPPCPSSCRGEPRGCARFRFVPCACVGLRRKIFSESCWRRCDFGSKNCRATAGDRGSGPEG